MFVPLDLQKSESTLIGIPIRWRWFETVGQVLLFLISRTLRRTESIKLSTSMPNFWPGYFVVESLIELRCKELETSGTEAI